MPEPTVPVVCDPPATGPNGKSESSSTNVTFSIVNPIAPALLCVGTFPRRPHERRLGDIHLAHVMVEGNGGCVIEDVGRSGTAALNPPSDGRCHHFAVMPNSLQLPISAGRKCDLLGRRRPMTGSAEHGVSGQF